MDNCLERDTRHVTVLYGQRTTSRCAPVLPEYMAMIPSTVLCDPLVPQLSCDVFLPKATLTGNPPTKERVLCWVLYVAHYCDITVWSYLINITLSSCHYDPHGGWIIFNIVPVAEERPKIQTCNSLFCITSRFSINTEAYRIW